MITIKVTRTFAAIPLLAFAVLTAMLRAGGPSAQQPQPSEPKFRSGVELLRIHVTVVDERGRPIRDLNPSDFSVQVDEQDRQVLFAHFFGPPDEGPPGAKAPTAPNALLPSYALNTASAAGRVVVFVVDLISVKQGYEKLVLDTAAKLVDGLGPNDAVGLMPIPGKGVDLTRDRTRVSEALRMLRGTTNIPFISHYFTLSEAVAFEQHDRRVIAETIERECCQRCSTCPNELRDETRELLRHARYHVQSVLTSMTGLATLLQQVQAPTTIVLISAGLPFEQESLSRFTELQESLTRAGIMIYAVQVSQGDNDAINMRRPGVGTYRAADITTGLANVATMAGGAMFMGVGTASGIFERLRSEIVHAYELGVQATPKDDDGKTHDVKVTVNRPGVTVRSRRKVILPENVIAPDTKLRTLLAQPVDVADLPVAAAAYTMRGEEAATLKVIITAELARGISVTSPLHYALMVMQDGKAVFQSRDAAVEEANGARVVTAAQLAPGRYRLRLAAIDGSGRGGTVEVPVGVGLRTAADLQFSDVIIGVSGPSFTPVIHARVGQTLSTLVELYSNEPARFATAKVDYEVRRANEPTMIGTSPGTLRATALERRQVAEGSVTTTGLSPGAYTVSAIISVDGKPVGRVSRGVLLEP